MPTYLTTELVISMSKVRVLAPDQSFQWLRWSLGKIVSRRNVSNLPDHGERRELKSGDISLDGGVHGDHWAKGSWESTVDGRPHPDAQICMMNARCIALIAQDRANWAPAGDNFFIDMDLSPGNLPPGQ